MSYNQGGVDLYNTYNILYNSLLNNLIFFSRIYLQIREKKIINFFFAYYIVVSFENDRGLVTNFDFQNVNV